MKSHTRLSIGDRIRFPSGALLWQFIRKQDGTLCDPYTKSNRPGFINVPYVQVPINAIAQVIDEEQFNGQRILGVRVQGMNQTLVINMSRDSLVYRRM